MNGPFLAIGLSFIRTQFHLATLSILTTMAELKLKDALLTATRGYQFTAEAIDQTLEVLATTPETGITQRDVNNLLHQVDDSVADALQALVAGGYTENGKARKPLTDECTKLGDMIVKFNETLRASKLPTGVAEPEPIEPKVDAQGELHNPLTCPECGEGLDENQMVVAEVPMLAKDIERARDILTAAGILLRTEDMPPEYMAQWTPLSQARATFH